MAARAVGTAALHSWVICLAGIGLSTTQTSVMRGGQYTSNLTIAVVCMRRQFGRCAWLHFDRLLVVAGKVPPVLSTACASRQSPRMRRRVSGVRSLACVPFFVLIFAAICGPRIRLIFGEIGQAEGTNSEHSQGTRANGSAPSGRPESDHPNRFFPMFLWRVHRSLTTQR